MYILVIEFTTFYSLGHTKYLFILHKSLTELLLEREANTTKFSFHKSTRNSKNHKNNMRISKYYSDTKTQFEFAYIVHKMKNSVDSILDLHLKFRYRDSFI